MKKYSISENTYLRYFNFIALYFAQGVPEGMLTFGIPAWLAMNGKSPTEIALFTAIVVLPWSFKFVVAPMMDRYTYLPMGRKRPWIILGQLGLIVSSAYMAFINNPLNNLHHLMMSGFVISFFGALQDVATDGMAVDIIPADQQAKANGFMWGAKIVGMSFSLAVGSWLLNKFDFTAAMIMVSVVIGVIMLVPLLLRERSGEKMLPWTSGKTSPDSSKQQLQNWSVLFKSLYSVFKLRNSLIIALLLFMSNGAFKYIATLLPIFTIKELNWTNVEYSQYFATAKMIGGIVGMLIGGVLIDRFGKKQMLHIYFFLMFLVISAFVIGNAYWYSKSFIFSFMIAQNIMNTFVSIGVLATAMQCCWKKVSASQFTIFMTIANLGQMTFAALVGPISENFDWNTSILYSALFILIAWLILKVLNIEKQVSRVAELEEKNLNVQPVESY